MKRRLAKLAAATAILLGTVLPGAANATPAPSLPAPYSTLVPAQLGDLSLSMASPHGGTYPIRFTMFYEPGEMLPDQIRDGYTATYENTREGMVAILILERSVPGKFEEDRALTDMRLERRAAALRVKPAQPVSPAIAGRTEKSKPRLVEHVRGTHRGLGYALMLAHEPTGMWQANWYLPEQEVIVTAYLSVPAHGSDNRERAKRICLAFIRRHIGLAVEGQP